MEMSFLGGAREIGASSCLICLEEKFILFDAGLRLNHRPKESIFPKFRRIRKLDLIIITHAHLDHLGALPVLSQKFPETIILMTEETFELGKILLRSNFQIMETNLNQDLAAFYEEKALEIILRRIFLVTPDEAFKPFYDRDIKITFLGAGHIQGAVSILLEGEKKKILYTGDFMIANQRTVKGFKNKVDKVDLLISEASYADAVHPLRLEEEKLLAEQIKKVIEKEGIVLIPCFALGRAQELIVTLAWFEQNKWLPRVPIYFDGLVVPIFELYQKIGAIPDFVSSFIQEINTQKKREEIINQPPAIIIASSGNLNGGRSEYYASKIISGKNNAIFFSGYLDEESPGRKLLSIKKENQITLAKKKYEVRAQLVHYNFSAHSDVVQLKQLIFDLDPKVVVLVHGLFLYMKNLAKTITNKRVWLPDTKITFDPFGKITEEYFKTKQVYYFRSPSLK